MKRRLNLFAGLYVMIAGFVLSVSSAAREFGRAVYIIALDMLEVVALLAPPLPSFSLVDYSAFSLPKVRAFLSRVSERLRYRSYRPV